MAINTRLHAPQKAKIIGVGGGMRGAARGSTCPVVDVDCAVVLTVSCELTAPPFEGVREAGLARHNVPCGRARPGTLRQLIVTACLKLLIGDIVTE